MPRWLYVFALVLLVATVASSYELVFYGGLATDPPSVSNMGPGGLSLIAMRLRLRGVQVVEVAGVDEVAGLPPGSTVLVVASPDTVLDEAEVEAILRWVASGGKLVVMDELGSTKPLLERLGIQLGERVEDVSLGYCRIGKVSMSVLFDVYAPVYGGQPMCNVSGYTVAAMARYGRGIVYVYGDSSIAINEVLASPYGAMQQQYLYNTVFNRPIVAFYEARFLVVEERVPPATILLMMLFAGPLLVSKAVLEQEAAIRLGAVLMVVLAALFFTASRMGLYYPAHPKQGRREKTPAPPKPPGASEWQRWLEKQHGSKR